MVCFVTIFREGLEIMKVALIIPRFGLLDFLARAEDGEESEATTGELTEFIEKAKMGEITNQDIPKFAKMFKVCHRGSLSIVPEDVWGGVFYPCEVPVKRYSHPCSHPSAVFICEIERTLFSVHVKHGWLQHYCVNFLITLSLP